MKWADSNFFISEDVTSLSNCCRLQSDIKDIGYFNSIGGSALEVGSIKVNTINLARIAYESTDEEKYIENLKELIELNLIALDTVRSIIKRNIEKNLLPNYSLGIINMDTQYNTIGIIGLYEALQEFGYIEIDEFGNSHYTESGMRFAAKILDSINIFKEDFKEKYNCDYFINVEQIPGERAAEILMEKDRIFHPDKKYELPLYGNQWIPLAVKCTLAEKIRTSAALDRACGGGSIAHINLEAPITNFDTAWKLLNHIAKEGVVYFAFNLRINACEHNHGFFGETCPICGKPKTTSYQRIVGFLTPEKNYSSVRKKEFAKRDWLDLMSKGDLF